MLTRWNALPRDSRDTLFLLVVVGWTLAPQAFHLPPWAAMLAYLLLLWRGQLAWRSAPLPGRWWMVGLVVLTVAATFATFRTIAGREAGVTLVVMLLALKTLELRARRDAMVVFFLGFFVMLTNFLFSQSLPVALSMVVALAGLLTALVQAHMPVGRPPLADAGRIALRLMLFGAPVMAALFLLFPRIGPLWGMPGDDARGRSGLSADMQVGTIAELALDDGVAMRLRFPDLPAGTAPPQQQLYFRGPVLSDFDGRQWRAQPLRQTSARLEVQGRPVRYEATLEASGRPWLLTMDAAVQAPAGIDAFQTPDLQWLATQPLRQVQRYTAESYPDFRHGPAQPAAALRLFTLLPPGFDPRTRALAAEMKADPRFGDDTAALIGAALERLRTGGYRYTLEPGVYGRDTADTFWFDRKEGFCEHIASAFVVLMRAMDIPARIVTGYQGGDLNPVDGYWTVRNSDAHAWTEVWQPGRGWVRVDPTGAVAPDRVGQLLRLQTPRGAFATAFGGVVGRDVGERLRAVWEAIDNRWNQWVLNYTQSRQFDLLRRLGFASPDWEDLVRLLVGLAVLASVGTGLWSLWTRRAHDPWQRLLGQVRRRLARSGLALPSSAAPRGVARQARRHFGDAADPLHDWLLRLEAQRYAPTGDAATRRADLQRLRREFRSLPWPSSSPPRS
ncbi:DUF3488 and transglutaminase-like domain-containing protein [uncultured Xylophilus sp.]|uniref:transglutaminase family protein n=1 Tax=uncultured Xylophilus sp. TaxID=296832 RepID=UPI0025D767A5|nr:DUF3488 and transglutaminase-like domain-containing protein [uncultured Xylophilus sp.]